MNRRAILVSAVLLSLAAPVEARVVAPTQHRLSPAARAEMNGAGKTSVAYQADTTHTGTLHGSISTQPVVQWSVGLGGSVGYPVVANGIVVVAANGALIALKAKTGKVLWTQPAPTGGGWVGPAYDNGMIFSNVYYTNGSSGVGMYAFDEKTGKQIWSSIIPGQYAFSSPPTAANGLVYTGGAGSGGTVYAYSETNGALIWRAEVENGDNSSPVVTSTAVYVSYVCPQTYSFNAQSGSQNWHYSGPCEGGGGSTGVPYDNLLFVEDSFLISGYDGLVLTASAGQPAGNFNTNFTPAFWKHTGFFVTNSQTLVADAIPALSQIWAVSLSSDTYATPPFIVGDTLYIETAAGNLLAYAAKTGALAATANLGVPDSSPGFSAGLAYASHQLFVPAGPNLIALH